MKFHFTRLISWVRRKTLGANHTIRNGGILIEKMNRLINPGSAITGVIIIKSLLTAILAAIAVNTKITSERTIYRVYWALLYIINC
jgi:hypothetical protein